MLCHCMATLALDCVESWDHALEEVDLVVAVAAVLLSLISIRGKPLAKRQSIYLAEMPSFQRNGSGDTAQGQRCSSAFNPQALTRNRLGTIYSHLNKDLPCFPHASFSDSNLK